MPGILSRLVGWFRRGDGDPERGGASDDGGDEESEFVPSRLDASVLEAHGMSTASAERELAQIEEKADQLEEIREEEDRHR